MATIPAEIAAQVACARDVLERHLGGDLLALHLFGSAVDGGLKPLSDVDLLASVSRRLEPAQAGALARGLLAVSAPPGTRADLRALELTVIARAEVVPWRYAPRRELQFGEWLREDLVAGIVEAPVADPDLAVLLTKARMHSAAVVGPAAHAWFDPVPAADLVRTFGDTIGLWQEPADWAGDERNVALALARIWYSAATGAIAPKDVAADWVLQRLPAEHRAVLEAARRGYLREPAQGLAILPAEAMDAYVAYAKSRIAGLLAQSPAG